MNPYVVPPHLARLLSVVGLAGLGVVDRLDGGRPAGGGELEAWLRRLHASATGRDTPAIFAVAATPMTSAEAASVLGVSPHEVARSRPQRNG